MGCSMPHEMHRPLHVLCIAADHAHRLPHNETLRPYGVQLMQTAMHVLNTDNEENGLLCLRICFDLHKAYRPTLENDVPPFLEFVRKVGSCPPHACNS